MLKSTTSSRNPWDFPLYPRKRGMKGERPIWGGGGHSSGLALHHAATLHHAAWYLRLPHPRPHCSSCSPPHSFPHAGSHLSAGSGQCHLLRPHLTPLRRLAARVPSSP